MRRQTLGELVDRYIERHIKLAKGKTKNHKHAEREVRYAINAHLASWKNRKIGTIRRWILRRYTNT